MNNVVVLLRLTQLTWISIYSITLSGVSGAWLNGPMNGAFSLVILLFGALFFIFKIQVPAWNYTRGSLHDIAKLLPKPFPRSQSVN